MRSIKFFLIAFMTLSCFAVIAQDKLASATSEKKKGAKAEKAFDVIEKGALLSKVTFRRDLKAAGNVIEIEALNTSGGSVSLGNSQSGKSAVMPAATITDITSIQGNFTSTRDVSNSGRGVVKQLLEVVYPYRGRINVSDQVLEFEIKEPGFWKINIAVTE